MYVCEKCADQHKLTVKRGAMTATAPCEVCGALHDDWAYKFVVWESDLRRVFSNDDISVADQLRARKAAP